MPKPPLQLTRPARPEARSEQLDLRPAPSPEIDLNSPEVQAFSLRGRVTVPPLVEDGTGEGILARALKARSPVLAPGLESSLRDDPVVDDPWRYVAIKLPSLSGRKLSEIADLRCSKRTRVALELLQRPLRELARDHRAGECPLLRRVSAGVSRFGVSLILPQDLADDLRYVVETRGAVKAQVLARLLVPEIDALYIKEILRGP
jgi:hypothetical protein